MGHVITVHTEAFYEQNRELIDVVLGKPFNQDTINQIRREVANSTIWTGIMIGQIRWKKSMSRSLLTPDHAAAFTVILSYSTKLEVGSPAGSGAGVDEGGGTASSAAVGLELTTPIAKPQVQIRSGPDWSDDYYRVTYFRTGIDPNYYKANYFFSDQARWSPPREPVLMHHVFSPPALAFNVEDTHVLRPVEVLDAFGLPPPPAA
jgi:hypothetical protein